MNIEAAPPLASELRSPKSIEFPNVAIVIKSIILNRVGSFTTTI